MLTNVVSFEQPGPVFFGLLNIADLGSPIMFSSVCN